MQNLYPLKFETIFKDKIWGGQKIKTLLGKDFSPLPNCGETWEISGVPGDVSIVKEGPLKGKNLADLMKTYKGELVGHRVFNSFHEEFPLLIKFIDANDELSVQVHPGDELAKKRHNSFGKTEMWYIVQADEGSKLISGFTRDIDEDVYLKYFNEGRLLEILNVEEVKTDDVFFIPAGRVHTIGKGPLLIEIQQTSDLTYRIYDYDREDEHGNKRELHIEDALDAIDYSYYNQYKTTYTKTRNEIVNLVTCPYFTTNRLHFDIPVDRDFQYLDSFIIYVVFEGSATMETDHSKTYLNKGEALLVPASINQLKIIPSPEIKMLESFIPK